MTDDLSTKVSEFEDEGGGAVLVSEDKKLVVDVEGFEGPIDVCFLWLAIKRLI